MSANSSATSAFPVPNSPIVIADRFSSDAPVSLHLGDRLELLQAIKASGAQADLILTSPPYNVGKSYETKQPLESYLEDQRRTIEACLEVLSPNGSICWQVGSYISGTGKYKEVIPLDYELYPIFNTFGLKLRNRIIWSFGHGLHEKYRFSGRHETMLWLVRENTDYTFNLDAVRVPQKYPQKKHYKGPRKGQLSGNPLGANPGDVWNITNIKHNHPEKTSHPCQFPIAIAERMVQSLTKPGDLVVDPYLGSGTTAVAAVMHGRRAAGADIQAEYLAIAHKRLQQVQQGKENET